jgi:DNA polymerase III alpha subunit
MAAALSGRKQLTFPVEVPHLEAFCAALLNSQPMGFYAPAQVVRDAREHSAEVRPACVSA